LPGAPADIALGGTWKKKDKKEEETHGRKCVVVLKQEMKMDYRKKETDIWK